MSAIALKKTTLQNPSHKSHTIIKSRDLNEAHFPDFTLNEYRLYLLILSKVIRVDKSNTKEFIKAFFETHIITPQEFSEIFKVSINHCYGILKTSSASLIKKIITVKSSTGNQYITICSAAKYNTEKHHLEIRLSHEIIPYLDVSIKYVKKRLYEIADFKGLQPIRLYEFIISFKNLGRCKLSIEGLKSILGIHEHNLIQYKEFKRVGLIPNIKEINKIHPKLKLEFIEIKTGRKVTEIEFKFKKSKSKTKELDDDSVDTNKTLSITYEEDVKNRLVKLGVEKKIVKRYSKYLDSTLESAYKAIKKAIESKTLRTTTTAYFRYLMEI